MKKLINIFSIILIITILTQETICANKTGVSAQVIQGPNAYSSASTTQPSQHKKESLASGQVTGGPQAHAALLTDTFQEETIISTKKDNPEITQSYATETPNKTKVKIDTNR